MNKSKYNTRIPLHGMVLYYNALTDKFIGIPHTVDKIFNTESWEEQLKQFFPKHFDNLVLNGFIIDHRRDELAEIRLQNKQEAFESKSQYMMFYPTQDCNLKCWYCYESHIKDTRMNIDIQNRIVKMIEKKIEANAFDSLRIAFFGGEPLIDFHHITLPLSKRIKKLTLDAKKSFQSFFVTNATLITSDIINSMKGINPYFQITLDGSREKHDKVRIGKIDNHPTYDIIINSIKKIVSELYSSEYSQPILTLRINYDNNTLKTISELIDDLDGINKKGIYIHLERVWQTKGNVNENQKELLRDAIKQFISAGFYVGHGCFGTKRVSCPAETANYIIVNYDGNLFRCNGRTLTPSTREGYIEPDGTIVWDIPMQSKRLGLSTFENSKCLSCSMLPRCMGPCSQKLMEHNGMNDKICTLSTLDITLEEYLKFEFEMRLLFNNK